MATRLQDKKADLLERVVDRLHDQLAENQAERAEIFLRHYYRAVSAVDLLERDPLDLYGAALSHLRLAGQRVPGQATVRVYNPQIEQHGWQSTHTVIEIVTDDMPFLVDSVSMALNRLGLLIHITIHPVVPVKRDADGALAAVLESADANGGEAHFESFMHFEVDRQSDPERIEAIRDDAERVLADVRAAVEDWRTMLAKVETAIDDLRRGGKHLEATELAEAEAFLRWIAADHFTLLGYACYDLIRDKSGDQLQRVDGSALGLLRRQAGASKVSRSFAALPPALRRQARDPAPLVITKANTRSTVHRPVYLDYIGVRRFDAKGKVEGEHRFLGLFTSAAYNRNPRDIPLLRHKVSRMIERAQLSPTSHSGKALANILETYPRDELFQTSDDELFETVHEILHLHERQTIHLFLRRDAFARFVSCMVYVPRERYNTELRRRFQDILQEALNGTEVEFQAQVSESALARIQFIVRTPDGIPEGVDRGEIEARLVEAARSWGDALRDSLIDAHGEEEGNRMFRAYGSAIPVAYQEQVPARAAVPDIERIDRLAKGESELAMSFSRPLEQGGDFLRFKLMRAGQGIALSDVLPVLENMGLRVLNERPSEFVTGNGSAFWLHDFRVQPTDACELEPDEIGQAFQDMFARVWRGEAENDGLNELVLHAGLAWREVEVLRTYCRYVLQIGIPFSQAYMEQTLVQNAELAGRLVALFEARFDPALKGDRNALLARLELEFRAGLDRVANLDQDRILRRFMRLILATLRTNFYQPGDAGADHKPYLSIKIDPAAVPDMPLPRPAFEIFVYSPRMEGVHLRGGRVARGGIRWSDRREDFRTEVLGLMKAQMVKNGVIVPVGAKGGFVVKRPPRGGDRAALQAEVVHCYQTLMRGMLDLTDNRVGDRIVPPPLVVRFDDDDPYLVVAADKGTATFSDIANQISLDYGHWLGDAFASGGSAGYDHKGMGITARGAWESVKRLFLELGKDIQSEPFTAIGIGDMSGDVFGNGMLLSQQTRLIAAFDHRHVFIDPDPDPAVSFAERQRLFELPRSSWDDYERAKISAGGGVYPRTVKSIKLSPQARAALDVEDEEFTPHELIRAILLAPVELFWNGGIGTYVKAAGERHADAFDRTNDAVRVDAEQLRCRVIGEGGNLGLTQRARIAFARKGRINTDFIDNSAGVDCSDHEVNIKILLGAVVDAGDMTIKQRDQLLAAMTDEVAQLVLRNNILQVQAISLAEAHPSELLDSQAAFMRRLEASGRLNRDLEVLPDEETLGERRQLGQGLFRPEVAVLIAYAKMALYDELLASDLPDDPYLLGNLIKYFPRPLRKRFRDQIAAHRLRREIIATLVANSLVNRGLGEVIGELGEQTGRSPASVARAYIVARDAFCLVPLFGELELLAKVVGADYQVRLLGEARLTIIRGTEWFLHHCPSPLDMRGAVDRFAPGIASLLDQLDAVLPETECRRFGEVVEEHRATGIDAAIARRLAGLPYLFPACEVIAVADQVGTDVATAGRTYFALDAQLHLGRLRRQMERSSPRNQWERIALGGLYEDLAEEHRRLTTQAFASARVRPHVNDGPAAAQEAVGDWLVHEVAGFGRWQRLLSELDSQSGTDLAMIAVAIRTLSFLDATRAAAA